MSGSTSGPILARCVCAASLLVVSAIRLGHAQDAAPAAGLNSPVGGWSVYYRAWTRPGGESFPLGEGTVAPYHLQFWTFTDSIPSAADGSF